MLMLTLTVGIYAQVESPLLILNRGALWHSLSPSKSGPAYNNWAPTGPTLDWPGFDASWIAENIGGTASHMARWFLDRCQEQKRFGHLS